MTTARSSSRPAAGASLEIQGKSLLKHPRVFYFYTFLCATEAIREGQCSLWTVDSKMKGNFEIMYLIQTSIHAFCLPVGISPFSLPIGPEGISHLPTAMTLVEGRQDGVSQSSWQAYRSRLPSVGHLGPPDHPVPLRSQ